MMAIAWAILGALVLLLGLASWWLLSELAGWRPVQPETIGITSIFVGIATATVGVGLI